MRIGHIELPVSDPRSSARFFADVLGFQIEIDDEDVSWVRLGGFELQLRRGRPHVIDHDEDAVNLVLYSEDVTSGVNRLHAAGVTTSERANCHHFRDPDGYWWQLVDPSADHSAT